MTDYDKLHKIREASDVRDEHVQEAADMRDGLYGGERLSWDDIIDRLEAGTQDDWGNNLESNAIDELKRRVRIELRER